MNNTPLNKQDGQFQLPNLQRQTLEPRALKSIILSTITILCAICACIPLFSVLLMLIYRGGKRLNFEVFYSLPPTAFETGGGFGNAIVGTLFMVGIAALISVPFGVLSAIFLAEFDPNSKIASVARFAAKTMSGLPSIIAGVFVYALLVVKMKTYSAWAGGIALSLLMLPVVLLAAEEAIKMVPKRMKEAAFGMGCTPAQSMTKVVLPVALPGIITGVVLAVARAAGETAPLLFTAASSEMWLGKWRGFSALAEGNAPLSINAGDWTASLAVMIYNYSSVPYENQIELAWTASLVLVVLVFVLNLISRAIGSRTQK